MSEIHDDRARPAPAAGAAPPTPPADAARPVPASPAGGSEAAEHPLHHPVASEDFDRDLNIPAILWTTAGVIAVTLLSVVAMWGMFVGFDVFDRRGAAPPPPMPEARSQPAPPEPRLQPAPPEDMRAMRAEEDRLLQHAGWIDRAQGTVRVPIAVAMDVLAERGLPQVTTPPLAETAAGGTYAADGRPPTDQPSPGTLLPPPGMGVGNIGPPSAGAGQLPGAAEPDRMQRAGEAAAGVNAQSAPQPVQPSRRPPRPERPPRTPVLPPPPPGGRP
jgi:hypothetical protein